MSKQTQLFPVGLFVSFLTVILGIIANCFIKQNKILLAKIIILSIFGTMASFAIHIFSLSSFGSGRLHISIGMTIGYIFIMLYVLSDVLENKTFFSYLSPLVYSMYINLPIMPHSPAMITVKSTRSFVLIFRLNF